MLCGCQLHSGSSRNQLLALLAVVLIVGVFGLFSTFAQSPFCCLYQRCFHSFDRCSLAGWIEFPVLNTMRVWIAQVPALAGARGILLESLWGRWLPVYVF